MNKKQVILIISAVAIIAVALYSGKAYGGLSIAETKNVDLLGSSTAPISLSTAYTGAGSASSSEINAKGYSEQSYFVSYLPQSEGSVLHLLIEESPDCETYYARMTETAQTDETMLNTTGTGIGVPYTFPYGITSASGTTYTFKFETSDIAKCLKLSAKEFTTSTAGTIFAETYMTN